MNLDGTGLRRLTRGKYDDFDARYLPNGEIVFLSTRRGQYVQCSKATATASVAGANPDSYVRCGGGPERPVAVYTLHVMDADGGNLRQISAFEMFEWTPSVDHEGRVLYARWDYVDRWNMPFMKLWSTMPDGTNAQAIYGNYSQNPHCVFEARAIPNSRKLIFTASGHHANTGGSLVLLDFNQGADSPTAMTRLTPEVCFPETEGWPKSYFINPFPLSENHYLAAWSDLEMIGWPGPAEPVNATGIYLFDAFGNLNLLYRDPDISSMSPLPVRARPRPHAIPSQVAWDGAQEGRMLLLNVYDGLASVPRGTIKRLRLVGVPAKTHPTMNYPEIGVTRDDPGKFVIGSVPVDEDGSAFFRVPSGVSFFFQALDADGMAVQTMRSAAYVQPGQTHTCVGCHEPRNSSPPNLSATALGRDPSKITPGPAGSWPLDFSTLVQPVMEAHCVSCHKPTGQDPKFDVTAKKAYAALVDYGKPSLREHVMARYLESRSIAGAGAAQQSPLLKLLKSGHYDVKLLPDAWERLAIWMDTYGQRQGHFSPEQEKSLHELRRTMAGMLTR
jgi:mono/diheme cytochrome c family protein